MPTRPRVWGRPRGMGKQSTHAPVPIRRGSGHGTYAWWFGQRGRPVAGEGSGLNIASGDGYGGSRTGPYERRGRVTRGAKGPDFWHAFEDGEDKVIGDEPHNTR